MELSPYSAYSAISLANGKKSEEIKKILALVDKFQHISDAQEAKTCLQKELNLNKQEENIISSKLEGVTFKETQDSFCVNLAYQNENISFYYKK